MPLVAELPKEGERLLEMLDRHRHGASVNESKREIVEGERLCARVVEVTHDRQRGEMLLGGPFVLPVASQLCPELVESTRLVLRVGSGRFLRTNLEGVPGLMSCAVREAPQALPGLELVERRP